MRTASRSTMAERERETILADFQACTGLEDIGEAIVILEQHDWNLMSAVQTHMAGMESPMSSSNPGMEEPSAFAPPPYQENIPEFFPQPVASLPGMQVAGRSIQSDSGVSGFRPVRPDLGGGGGGAAAAAVSGTSSSSPVVPSTSSGLVPRPSRMLNFNVEYRDRNVPLYLPDIETVGKIKELLESDLGVPASKMVLRGWVNKFDNKVTDEDILKDLKLPKDNNLFLLTPEFKGAVDVKPNNGENPNLLERLSQTFTLNIRYRDKEVNYQLNFPGSRTIQEVKGDVYSLIDVPVRYQVWKGWPDEALDESMTLAGCGIGYPCHTLEVTSSKPGREDPVPRSHCSTSSGPQEVQHTMPSKRNTTPIKELTKTSKQEEEEEWEEIDDPDNVIDVDGSDIEDFEDAHESFNLDEDMFGAEDTSCGKKPRALLPENARDQTAALEHFTEEFSTRYGDCHPVFFIGSLEDAIREALQAKARDRKLLAIYLHHDNSILSNVFCSQILCAESVVTYLSTNFITWAWDLTSEANKARLLTMCTQHFGSVAANTVRNFRPDELPLLLIISRNRSVNEVVNVIRANITLDELMTHLIQAVEVFHQQQRTEIVEEDEREERESMLREQDEAYQESLAADRAKAEARRQEEEEKRQFELQEAMKRDEEERTRREEEEQKEAIRQSVQDQLPDEPPANCTEPISRIRIRVPGGETIVRRFLAQHPLQVLLNFITSKGYHVEDFKVLTTFPRRDLTQLDLSATLQDLKLFPQETVILEEK